ncbi:MAG: FAD-dependent monooxygenase [Casimicrobiaceae bacterium]
MDSERFDVVIAGAGLVGMALAPALARAGLSVALVDRAPIAAPEYDPATWDARVYAISPGSAVFLRALGAWQLLPADRVTPIEAMRVVGDAGGSLSFSAYDLSERALAWIVEERALRGALLQGVHDAGVTVVGGMPFVGLAWSAGEGTLTLGAPGEPPRTLAARLIVGADGVRSWVREAAGIMAQPKPYGQTAVVANFTCQKAHQGEARQWFGRDGGVLAWLPLPGRRISIVWSAPDTLAEELRALTPEALAERVADAGENALGKLVPLTAAAGFPLSLLKLPTTIAHRLVLVGDAAHGVHPLAGQGVNLGFGDAMALAQVEAERGPVTDPGTPLLLERFARRRVEPVLAMQAVTDGLARLFGRPAPWLSTLRNAGLAAVDRLPLVKRALAQPALR